jgi:hypothetical protein
MEQLRLFGSGLEPVFPATLPHSGTDTSRRAAERAAVRVTGRRLAVLRAYAAAGDDGLTDAEGQDATGIPGDTWRPRRGELADVGFVAAAGVKRPTRYQNDADVHRITDAGREWLASGGRDE